MTVQGRPSVVVDMTLADSDTDRAVSLPQSQASLSNRREGDVSLHHASEDSDQDGVSVASGEAPAVPEVDFHWKSLRSGTCLQRSEMFRRMDGCDVEHLLETGNSDENGAHVHFAVPTGNP